MQSLRVGIVAGEASGDQLGAALMQALRMGGPVEFAGAGGGAMRGFGLDCHVQSESLAVMGLSEVVRHLPRLLGARRALRRHLLAWRPHVVVGVDAPDFNLGLEAKLRAAGIPTVHYVSPTVWAWRPGRVRKVRRSADLVLCLLPFEPGFYKAHGVRAEFVGHPMADVLSPDVDRPAARAQLGLAADETVVGLLPGSRHSEVERLGPVFADTAVWLAQRRPGIRFVAPMAGTELRGLFQRSLAERGAAATLLDGQSHTVLAAANAAVVASGTATLEAMLLGCPLVACYRVSRLTAAIARPLMIVDRFAMPNLLAGDAFVPEFIQDSVTPAAVGQAVLDWIDAPARVQQFRADCAVQHARLRQGASLRAARAIRSLLK